VSKVTFCNDFSANSVAWIEPKPSFTNCVEWFYSKLFWHVFIKSIVEKLSKNHLQGIHFTADFFKSLSFKKITAPPSIIGSIDYFNILDHFIGDYLTLKSTYQDLFLAYFEWLRRWLIYIYFLISNRWPHPLISAITKQKLFSSLGIAASNTFLNLYLYNIAPIFLHRMWIMSWFICLTTM
jgi:hypothetical protein